MRKIIQITPSMPQLQRKKRVAAYARVSMDSERLMHSLSAQVSYYSELIQKNPEWVYVGVYADEGITGTLTSKRDEFKRMLEDCEEGRIDIILVKSISRFARNTVDLLATVRHLKSLGIEVRFEKENINSLSSDGELMLSILASFAQEESRSISENVKWGARKRFKQGIPNGRVRVFGYRWEGDTLIVIPEEEQIVRRIYSDFLEGSSPRKIAEHLNNYGILTEKGCRWTDFTIRYILTNVTYTGNTMLQKTFIDNPISKKRKMNKGELPKYLVENTHEEIIDKTTFDKVQNEFIKRSEKRKSVFSAKIRCADCGESYIRNTVGKNKRYKVWVCSTKKRKGCRICMAKDIREDKLKVILAEVLGLTEFDENVFSKNIECIEIDKNILKFRFYDGTIKEMEGNINGRENSKDNSCNG